MKILILSMMLATLAACSNKEAAKPSGDGSSLDCDKATITAAYAFAAIQTKCSNRACHPGGNSPAVADFSTLVKLKAYINANQSTFALRVTSAQADMPQSQTYPPLTKGMRDSLACWISKGMPD
jgi:hypothetical protein